MVETYPAEVSTFKVVGRLVKGVIDSADVGQLPDVVPIVGAVVTFTPNITPPIFRVTNSTNPVTVFQETIIATTNADGYLITEATETALGVILPYGGEVNIVPTGWNWLVGITVGGSFPERRFSIMGAGKDTVMDLATVVPVPANPGVEIMEWQAVVTQVTSARDIALSARDTTLLARDATLGTLGEVQVLADSVPTPTEINTSVTSKVVEIVPGEVSKSLANNATVQQGVATAITNENIPGKVTTAVAASVAGDDVVGKFVDATDSATRYALHRAVTGDPAVSHAWLGIPHASQSIRKLDGSTAQTNLATNPSFEAVQAGTTIVRRNLVSSPQSNVSWVTNSGTNVMSSAQFHSGTTSMRVVPGGENYGYYDALGAAGVKPGVTYTFSIWVLVDETRTLVLRNYNTPVNGPQVVVVAGVWTRLWLTQTVPIGAGFVWLSVRDPLGTVVPSFYQDDFLIEQTDQLRPYFDGGTLDTLGFDYGWVGVADASVSTAKAAFVEVRRNFIPNPRLDTNSVDWNASYGSGGAGSSVRTDLSVGGFQWWFQTTFSTVPTAAGASIYNFMAGKNPVVAGVTYSAQIMGRVSWAGGPLTVARIYWYDSANVVIGSSTGDSKAHAELAAEWRTVTGVAPTGAAFARIDFLFVSGVAPGVGGLLAATGAMLEASTVVGSYFDGNTPFFGDFIHGWSGAVNGSQSIQSGIAVASAVPNGDAVIYRSLPSTPGSGASLAVTAVKATTNAGMYNRYLLKPGTYTFLVRVYVESGFLKPSNFGVGTTVQLESGSITQSGSRPITIAGEGAWTTLRWTFTTTVETYANCFVYAGGTGAIAGKTFWVDDSALIPGNYTGPYFDGGTPAKRVVETLDGRYAPISTVAALAVESARVMTGSGSPLYAVPAPVGTEWIDTAATLGVTRWYKKTRTDADGWVVVEGDTGWRNISATAFVNGATGTISVRRVGMQVQIKVYNLMMPSGITLVANIPEGFRFAAVGFFLMREYASAGTIGVFAAGPALEFRGPIGAYTYGATHRWEGANTAAAIGAWPTALPGIAE